MNKLLQNNLEESTTEMGFPADVEFPLQREVELEDGTTVIVEGVTPSKMKTILNQNVDGNEEAVTFKTPGEDYVVDNTVKINGVCQDWNASIVVPDLEKIEITTPPTKTVYDEGELFDNTGMIVTATYSNQTSEEITEYLVSPSGALATTDTEVTISYGGKTATQAITVNAVVSTTFVLKANTSYTFDPEEIINAITNTLTAEELNYTFSVNSCDTNVFLNMPNINGSSETRLENNIRLAPRYIDEESQDVLIGYLNSSIGDITEGSPWGNNNTISKLLAFLQPVTVTTGNITETEFLDDCPSYIYAYDSNVEEQVIPVTIKLSNCFTEITEPGE